MFPLKSYIRRRDIYERIIAADNTFKYPLQTIFGHIVSLSHSRDLSGYLGMYVPSLEGKDVPRHVGTWVWRYLQQIISLLHCRDRSGYLGM